MIQYRSETNFTLFVFFDSIFDFCFKNDFELKTKVIEGKCLRTLSGNRYGIFSCSVDNILIPLLTPDIDTARKDALTVPFQNSYRVFRLIGTFMEVSY